jgi:hypothetical protein
MSSKNIKQLQQEIEQALIYYKFWDQLRTQISCATQTADYFSGRLYKLRKELEDERKRQCGDSARETRSGSGTKS